MDRRLARCRAAIFRPTASTTGGGDDRPLALPAEPHARRLVRAYGRRVERILKRGAQAWTISAPRFAGDLTGAEVRYLVENEWAQSADDVLWRRSKLGLKATPEERTALEPVHALAADGAADRRPKRRMV